jgi:hypothetical protein
MRRCPDTPGTRTERISNQEIIMKNRIKLMVGLALAGALGTVIAAPGPTAPSASAASGQGPGGAPQSTYSADTNGPQTSEQGSAPVLHIQSVEVIRSTHAPALDVLRVRGLASTGGWEEAELIPLTRGIPADGVLQLVLVARAPAQAMDADGFEVVEAIFPLEPAHPFKGVNVHSATDSLAVNELPGYAENKIANEDCSHCVGKTFVARGARAPSGKPDSEVVHEEQLPAHTRVVKHTDGIPTADSDPNRLTLILGKDGKVTAAVWD